MNLSIEFLDIRYCRESNQGLLAAEEQERYPLYYSDPLSCTTSIAWWFLLFNRYFIGENSYRHWGSNPQPSNLISSGAECHPPCGLSHLAQRRKIVKNFHINFIKNISRRRHRLASFEGRRRQIGRSVEAASGRMVTPSFLHFYIFLSDAFGQWWWLNW